MYDTQNQASMIIPDSKILLVEDNPLILRSVEHALKTHTDDIYTASSLGEAVSKLDTLNPKIVVTDFNLGVENSFSLLVRAKTNPSVDSVIVMSSDTVYLNLLKFTFRKLNWHFIEKNQSGWIQKLGNIVKGTTKDSLL